VRNDEVRRTTGQPRLSAIVQARRLSLFGHIARMPDETDARRRRRRYTEYTQSVLSSDDV